MSDTPRIDFVFADFARLERELAEARKAYLDVADAICRESRGPSDLCEQARKLRAELAEARKELWNAISAMADLCAENVELKKDTARLDWILKNCSIAEELDAAREGAK